MKTETCTSSVFSLVFSIATSKSSTENAGRDSNDQHDQLEDDLVKSEFTPAVKAGIE